MGEFGGEILILKIHIDAGALWGDSGDGAPVTLEPAGDEPYEFTADDPDQGEYTICSVALLDMGVEVTGNKIKQ